MRVFNPYAYHKPNKRLTHDKIWWMKIVEAHSFAHKLLAAVAVCSSDVSHFATHIYQQPLALLWTHLHKTTWEHDPTPPPPPPPSSLRRVVDPSLARVGWGFGCNLWVVGYCGSGIWPSLVISLHLSLSLLFFFSLCPPYLSHTHQQPFIIRIFLQVTDLG